MTDLTPENFVIVVSHLEDALAQFRQGHPEGAAWRLADGALLLRRELEEMGFLELAGLDEPTGRGAVLTREHDPVREAAPELLGACEAAKRDLSSHYSAADAIPKLKAAIAKARGEAS